MVNEKKHNLSICLIPLFLCSEWRCSQPKETVALLCKHLKAHFRDSLLRDGRMLLSSIYSPVCVSASSQEDWKVCFNYSAQTPKLWTGVSSRQWVGAEVHAEGTSYMPRGINIQCYQNYMSQKLKENILWLPSVLNPTLRKFAQYKLWDDKMKQGLFLSLFVHWNNI